MVGIDRRTFLRRGVVVAAGALALGGPFRALVARANLGGGSTGVAPHNGGYGPLRAVGDAATGEVLLWLPAGFSYRSFGRAGEIMSDGVPTPGAHDGMAAFGGPGERVRLVRNHEQRAGSAFGDASKAYDANASGGTTTIEVSSHGEQVTSWVSLNGTNVNCAGGPTPWRSWISCEENINGPDIPDPSVTHDYRKKHGYVFEVPSRRGPGEYEQAVPIRSAGRFQHEAVAFDPRTGVMYETEDPFGDGRAGFYRYTSSRSRLEDGGRLEMLSVSPEGSAMPLDLRSDQVSGATYRARWVPITEADPDPYDPATNAPFQQGLAQGGAIFNRLEGCWYGHDAVYFTSTGGGDARKGQVWGYDVAAETLALVFESPGKEVLDNPDNVTISPRGGLLLCEDGSGENHLRGLDRAGRIFDFAKNAVPGFEDQEFAGATYSPAGNTLFVNIQTPGITFAIWGPWSSGAL